MIASTAPLLALLLAAQIPPSFGPADRFADFHEALRRRDVAVVFGTLSSSTIKEGKKERMKPGEAGLGEGGAQVVLSGTVYYRIRATGKLEVVEAHCGRATTGEKISLAFDMQAATLPSGEKRRHLLGSERTALLDETVGLFVIEKPPGKPGTIVRVTRFDVKTPEDLAKAKDTAADHYSINRSQLDLLDALAEATTLRDRGDKPGAAARLRAALDAKRTWRRLESDSVANTALSPARARAQELLLELERE